MNLDEERENKPELKTYTCICIHTYLHTEIFIYIYRFSFSNKWFITLNVLMSDALVLKVNFRMNDETPGMLK